ncbi:MAG: GDSL-type esterase/lipase family protein [Luteolibacter sp.]
MIPNIFFAPTSCHRPNLARWLRTTAFVAFISVGVAESKASTFAYEGFQYAAETPMQGQTGPIGFSAPFTASNDGLRISYGGSTYGDLTVAGNKLAFAGSNNNGNFGMLTNSPEAPGTTVYLSYLMQASPSAGYAGVSLFNGSDEVLFTGKRNGSTYVFGIEPKIGDPGNTTISVTRLSLVVVRIDFEVNSAVIRMYINPQTADEPAIADLSVTRTAALTYDSVRFQSNDVTGSVDEFRMGESYADVAPMTYGSVPSEIVVLGSSVAAGFGATPMETNGWAWRMKTLLETTPPVVPESLVAWNIHNASIPGNNTTAVINRFQNDVSIPRAGADIVMIGLSLANEGLIGTTDPQSVSDSFENGIQQLIDLCRVQNMYPVVTLCYPHNLYNENEYSYVRRMNLLLNTWNVPSVNFLGAIDDGKGRWASGFFADDGHPNSQGHQEMKASIVPSLFDAILAGKTESPKWDNTTGYLRLQQDLANPAPLTYIPAQEFRSLTLSLRVRTTDSGTVAAIGSGGTGATMEIRSNALVYVSPNGAETSIPATLTDGHWHDLALSYRNPTEQVLVFIDGQLKATVTDTLNAETFSLGGPGSIAGRTSSPQLADYQDAAIYRAAWTEDEALAQRRGSHQQASLEILATLDDPSPANGAPLINRAQSFSALNLLTSNFTANAVTSSPSNLSAVSYQSGTANLAWTDHAAGTAAFTIERRRSGIAEPWMTVGTSPSNQPFFEDSDLQSGTSYDYRVSVAEGTLQSDYSQVVSVTPAGQAGGSYDDWIVDFYPSNQNEPVYLVDFNTNVSPDYGGAFWNTVSSTSDSRPLTLHDSDGISSGITVSISDSFDQSRTDAGSVLTDYPSSAQGTLFALRDDTPLTGAITFAGLDSSAVYDFSFLARRGALVSGFDYTGTYTFTGGGSPMAVTVDASTNTLMTQVPGIAPNASGVITLTISAGPGNDTDFPVINFLKFQKGRPGTYLVDFNTTASPNYGLVGWNTVSNPNPAGPYALNDLYGANQGVVLNITDGFDQNRTDAGSPMSDFAPTAQTTLFALKHDGDHTASMTFSGLDTALEYDISFFSRRGNLIGGFDYTGIFTFTGVGAPVVVVTDAAENSTLTKAPPVTPDASGNITLAIRTNDNSASAELFATLNFIRLAPRTDERNYAALIDPYADPDGDGRTNFEEYARGFDPTVADGSPLQLEEFKIDGSAVSRFQITRDRFATEADCILESTQDLISWSEDKSATRSVIAYAGNIETLCFEVPPSGSKRFFRLALVRRP